MEKFIYTILRYEVFTDGSRGEPQKYLLPPKPYENLRPFFLGCSFGFENALKMNGISLKNIEQKKNVSMYMTNIDMLPVKLNRIDLTKETTMMNLKLTI